MLSPEDKSVSIVDIYSRITSRALSQGGTQIELIRFPRRGGAPVAGTQLCPFPVITQDLGTLNC